MLQNYIHIPENVAYPKRGESGPPHHSHFNMTSHPLSSPLPQRMTLVLVVALALLSSASAQRPSRLQQMVRGFMDDMSDMASRIGTGMLK